MESTSDSASIAAVSNEASREGRGPCVEAAVPESAGREASGVQEVMMELEFWGSVEAERIIEPQKRHLWVQLGPGQTSHSALSSFWSAACYRKDLNKP